MIYELHIDDSKSVYISTDQIVRITKTDTVLQIALNQGDPILLTLNDPAETERLVQVLRELSAPPPRPPIVCLCGSTRREGAKEAYTKANEEETRAGKIVLSVGVLQEPQEQGGVRQEKIDLDWLHRRKIDLADEVLILQIEGETLGPSTQSELDYARAKGKRIRFCNRPKQSQSSPTTKSPNAP